MKPISEMNRLELASFVSTKLQESGISVVLSGGSCVSIYSEDKYVSMDLDFIETGVSSRAKVTMCLENLGFVVDHRYFRHPEAELPAEFPAGPLGIGNEPISQFNKIPTTVGVLRLLTPTDCVKDRLAWFYHTGDTECLEQAYLVAQKHVIDLDEIARWSAGESKTEEFEKIKESLIFTHGD